MMGRGDIFDASEVTKAKRPAGFAALDETLVILLFFAADVSFDL